MAALNTPPPEVAPPPAVDERQSFGQPENVPAGIAWMVVCGLMFVCVTGFVRHLGSDMPAVEAAFIRYVIGLVLVAPALIKLIRTPLQRGVFWLCTVRGVVHSFAVMLWFYAMARIPIAEVTAIGYTAPIFVTIGAALFLGEGFQMRRFAAVLCGLVGAIIILRPGLQEISTGHLAQLGAAPVFAASFIIAKKLTGRADPSTIVAMLSLFCTIFLFPVAWLQWRDPTLDELFWLAMTAVFATGGHYAQTRAFRAAPITVTQPITFLQLVWAALVGLLIFGEEIDPFVLLGGGVIVASATYISHREAQAARRSQADRLVVAAQ